MNMTLYASCFSFTRALCTNRLNILPTSATWSIRQVVITITLLCAAISSVIVVIIVVILPLPSQELD